MVALRSAGIDAFIIRPFAPAGGTVNDTIRNFGDEIGPAVEAADKR
jgi:hypothetical protein